LKYRLCWESARVQFKKKMRLSGEKKRGSGVRDTDERKKGYQVAGKEVGSAIQGKKKRGDLCRRVSSEREMKRGLRVKKRGAEVLFL